MAIIDSLKDKLGNIIYPKTLTKAIYDKITNKRLDVTLNEIDNKIGNLPTMTTTEKSNLAGAISEVKSQVKVHEADGTKHWVMLPWIPVDKSIGEYIKENIALGVRKGVFGISSTAPQNPNVNQGGYIKYICDLSNTGTVEVSFRATDNSEYISLYQYTGAISHPWERVVTDKPIPWINATLQNGWIGGIVFRKNTLNQLEIRGFPMNGVTNAETVITQLPPAYSPTSQRIFGVIATSHDATVVPVILILSPEGHIVIRHSTTARQLFIDGIILTLD